MDSLIPCDALHTDLDLLFSVVEKNGKVVLLKENKPVYFIVKYDARGIDGDYVQDDRSNHTLQEAMRIVVSETDEKTMHASNLADEIYERKLYVQKNGMKARYTQIRARCGHYPEMFEALPRNHIRLKEGTGDV